MVLWLALLGFRAMPAWRRPARSMTAKVAATPWAPLSMAWLEAVEQVIAGPAQRPRQLAVGR